MGIIAKYKFNQNTYADFIPEFNTEFTDYVYNDEIDTDGYTIRTLGNDSGNLPTLMRFGKFNSTNKDRENCLLEVIECNTSQLTTALHMFNSCINLTNINTNNWNTEKITNMGGMFWDCSSLTSLDVSNFNTEKVENMQSMFQGCSSLTSLDVSNFNTEKVSNMQNMFYACSSLTSLDLSNFNTEKVTNMTNMFTGCSSLTSLDVSNFNTEKVTNMYGMFQNCSSLTSLDVSNFNTEKVENMQSMFNGCSSLTSLDVSNFNTEKVENMQSMFGSCSSLTSLDVSSFDVSQTKDMSFMFAGSSLTSLDLSSFKINQTTNINYMFRLCNNLTFLDISNFDIDDNNSIEQLFYNTLHITDIGMVYCDAGTINKISEKITTNTTIWYQDANPSDLTEKANITYKKYQSTTLSLNEPIQLRSIGNVHDEINYETGEYIQRIGEIVFDGSEDWQRNEVNGKNAFTVPHGGKAKGGVISLSSEVICDKNNVALHETFFYVGGSYFNYLTTKDFTRTEFKQYLQSNPITVQYQLAQPIITKIDTTILDQNNTYKSSQQTYDEQTYISVQSDTVVTPTSSVDYEIYSSTGTVTGTSATIENAEAGTPVSGVVYGETLLNVIQEPSEDEFVCTDNFEGQSGTLENTVEGNIKSAILKGQTLVNLAQPSLRAWTMNPNSDTASLKATTEEFIIDWSKGVPNNAWVQARNDSSPVFGGMLKANTDYTFIIRILENNPTVEGVAITGGVVVTFQMWGLRGYESVHITLRAGVTGTLALKYKFNRISTTQNIENLFGMYVTNNMDGKTIDGGKLRISKDIIILEGDYTNNYQDIPYFDGIGSVTNYRTINNIQPTCTYTENNGTYWCDTTTVNPTVGKQYFIKIFNNPNNIITRFFYGGVIVDTTTDYGIVTATDRTGMRLHFYNLNKDTVTITEEQKNAIRFLICEYQDGMENWEINEHFEESYTVQMPILTTVGKNLFDVSAIPTDYQTDYKGVSGYTWLVDTVSKLPVFKLKPNTTYTMSIKINKPTTHWIFTFVDSSHQPLVTINSMDVTVNQTETFTTNNDGEVYFGGYLTLQYRLGEVIEALSNGQVQIEEGSVATEYEPFKSTTVTVNENIELYSMGDIYDEFNVTTGELTKRIGEYQITGDENWDFVSNSRRLQIGNPTFIPNLAYSEFVCDKLQVKHSDDQSLHGTVGTYYIGYTSDNWLRIILGEDLTSLEQGKEWLRVNKPTIQYQFTTESIKTVDLSIVDQDNVQQKYVQTHDTITYLKPQSYELIPTIEYKNPSYDVLLKENTQYTIKLNRTNIIEGTPLTVNLGGTELSIEDSTDSFTIATPSTLVNNTLTLSGFGNKVKEVMVIERDCVDRDLDFFEGFVHVENPIMNIYHDMDNINFYSMVKWKTGSDYSELCRLPIKGQTIWYKVRGSMWNYVQYYDKDKNYLGKETNQGMGGSYQLTNGLLKPELKSKAVYFSINKRGNPTDGGYPQLRTKDNKPDVPPTPLSEICRLMTYPQITLRSIGDIKDEWDVVGETVTRRIGEVVLDGSENWVYANNADGTIRFNLIISDFKNYGASSNGKNLINNKLPKVPFSDLGNRYGITTWCNHVIFYTQHTTINDFKQWLSQNPITVQYELTAPVTESVRITPPNPQTSTASITIPTQLNYVEDTSDFLVWNPYKEHYVRYNYVEDGVVLDNYTWENLTDLDERQFVEFYNRRTYIDQPYHGYVASHDSKGTSKYVLIEPNQDYTVSVRFSELPTCEIVKVNLGGAEVEMNVNDPHVHITTPNTLANNLCSISGDGLDGKVTDILVIHCLEHEGFADIDYFEGIDGIGEIVEVDGIPKSKIVMEQTNGNLIDEEFKVWNNGQSLRMNDNERLAVHPNTKYIVKFRRDMDKELAYTIYIQLFNKDNVQTRIINGGATQESNTREFTTNHDETMVRLYTSQLTNNGSTHRYCDMDLCCANMEKDYIRPRYYDKEEILLPIQLHRINTVYDNFYYDEMKGYYRIQQSIGHKYFVGADSENWTLVERGQRVLRFRYNNADIQMKSLGEFMTNRLPNGTATSPYECCAFNGINFIVSIDKERLSSESLTAFKEWLANNNLHLYYQLASPLMIDLPEYSSRIEFNTYKDELYTFFKNCKPTVFTLAVPLDQTYRFYELEQGEGYANRVELTDERMTEEDTLYINTIYGSGIGNLIEEPNNVDTMLKPNYEGKATSHSLINGKVSTIGVHGFEPNDVTISNYNTVTKQYELTVQAQQGTNTNTKVLPIPYKFEVYEDGTKDKVYYNSQYKQWMFEGGQTLTVPYNASTGAFTNVIEVFRGLQPRSGLIGEFKVRFASGTTSARLYYSINGTTYGYTTLRGMTDEVDYYIGFFNTGGSKIDMGTKIDANAEYTTLVPINGTIPECLMINQIQSITECTYYQDKIYYYSDVVSPLLLDVYNGTTTITELNGAVIDIQNNAHNKQALIYGDTTYTVYWTYVGGEGNIKVTLGGATQEVVATQGYVTITTSDTDLEKGLFIGGFNVTIKDLMLVKGERIENLKYFEGSRAVGTAFTDENGETMYKITLVTGSELINDKFEEIITFEDNKKHNVVVTKLLGAKPDKI